MKLYSIFETIGETIDQNTEWRHEVFCSNFSSDYSNRMKKRTKRWWTICFSFFLVANFVWPKYLVERKIKVVQRTSKFFAGFDTRETTKIINQMWGRRIFFKNLNKAFLRNFAVEQNFAVNDDQRSAKLKKENKSDRFGLRSMKSCSSPVCVLKSAENVGKPSANYLNRRRRSPNRFSLVFRWFSLLTDRRTNWKKFSQHFFEFFFEQKSNSIKLKKIVCPKSTILSFWASASSCSDGRRFSILKQSKFEKLTNFSCRTFLRDEEVGRRIDDLFSSRVCFLSTKWDGLELELQRNSKRFHSND